MIDLHIHSNNSDGDKSVIEILSIAQKLALSAISFTDHETCNAYYQLERIDVNKFYNGKIINGIELKSQYKDIVIDVLGYGIDYKKMTEYLSNVYENATREKIQEQQLEEFYLIGKENNLYLRSIDELEWDKTKDWASIVFYDELKSHIENKEKVPDDMWESFKNFKTNHYHIKEDKFYINMAKYYPKIEDIIDIIHKSGGKAFIAHIFEYKQIEDKIKELEKIINEYDIDGIECYYSNYTKSENIKLLEFTKKHNLLISGGSDYHGDKKPNIQIGIGKGNLEIPNEILKYWNFI